MLRSQQHFLFPDYPSGHSLAARLPRSSLLDSISQLPASAHPPKLGCLGPVMAPCVGCFLLAALISASCKAITSSDPVCTEKEANRRYNCENLGLREIPDTLPNTTEFLEFDFNFLPTIQNTTFSRLINLIFLDLTRCQINWVHEDTFQNHHQLSTIVLTGNPLIFMAETSLTGPKLLKHLFLTQTGISNLEFIPVHNLENLESLHLGSNHISSINLPENFPIQNLKVLDFQNNAIHYISGKDVNALEQATNLSLNFNGNDIKDIEPGAFNSKIFRSLKFGGSLNLAVILKGLQNSTIQSLWLGTFEDTVDQDLTPATFEGLCNMSVESINLQKHHFHGFSPSTFRCFTQLQELDLTATHLNGLPPGIEGMNSLKKLVLNANSFDQLCQINAASFPSLTDLSIKGNMKKLDLGARCLEKLGNLQKLDLSHSDIEAADCCNLQFKNLHHLQYLNMSYNQPLGLEDQAFKECPRLELLDFAFTHLHVKASQSPFQNLHVLRVLNLSHCLLDASNQHLLAGLLGLQHLNLQGNRFQDGHLSRTNLLQTASSLEVLILSSCDLLSIDQQAFHSLGNMSHLDLSHNSLTGDSMDALSPLKGTYLNLAANNIRIIPYHLLPTLSQQNTINLSHNPLDCTCSNINFITWYKENLHKLEGSEETVCANPQGLRGVKLADVSLSCGITDVGIFFLVVFVLLFIVLLRFLVKFLLRWKYQHI
ncbi:CD180 antigen [Hippopotamus amphibius kiboko]|uniref:CD180 antigen n=1 Tax=Hippopotamus amphibius kiboko TaxID=575201 RepID=UPI00259877CB|nr:CD180 antigen [Hippopotamus amphibius kiboko]